jgi:hypothetical protein
MLDSVLSEREQINNALRTPPGEKYLSVGV